jgi:hypothetical protein
MSDAAEDLLSEIGLGEPSSGPPVTKEPLFIRDLTAEDIASVGKRAAYGSQSGQLIQKLRAPHHTLARLLAEGKKHPECSIITGYTVEYVVMLERDPAFQELVSFYKEQITPIYLNVHERLATLGAMAMEIIQERMTDPEKVKTMTTGQLREIMNDALDRSVAPSKVGAFGAGSGQQMPAPVISINFVSPPAAGSVQTLENNTRGLPMLDITPEKSGA